MAISVRCFSPDERSDTCFRLYWSRPNVRSASLTTFSSSSDSHQTLLTKGYLPSITMSMTDIP